MLYPPPDGYCPDVLEGYGATLEELYSVFQDILFWATFLVGERSRTSSLNFCDLICRKCDRVLEAIKVFRNSSISTFFSQKLSANFYKKREKKHIITRTCMTLAFTCHYKLYFSLLRWVWFLTMVCEVWFIWGPHELATFSLPKNLSPAELEIPTSEQ